MKFAIHESVVIRILADVVLAVTLIVALARDKSARFHGIEGFEEAIIFGCSTGIVLWAWSWISVWRVLSTNHPLRHQVAAIIPILAVELLAVLMVLLSYFPL